MKEWKGVIEKIRGSILLFCREKRGRQEASVILTSCSDKKLNSTLFNGHADSHQKIKVIEVLITEDGGSA